MLEGTLNGEPDRMVHSNIGFASVIVSEVLMGAFGVVVVLLLLNLLIASFNYTFDSMHQNVHANYRVAFARVVVDTCVRPSFSKIASGDVSINSFCCLQPKSMHTASRGPNSAAPLEQVRAPLPPTTTQFGTVGNPFRLCRAGRHRRHLRRLLGMHARPPL